LIIAARKSATAAVIALVLLSAGCSIVPATGPQGTDVVNQSEGGFPTALPYALVRVTPDVVGILGRYAPQLSTAFADRAPPRAFRFGIGDIVSITIFEAAAGGLFTAENGLHAGNFVTIPNQAVDDHGNIAVPYAGVVRAQGRTPAEIQTDIADALKARALEPQVVVALAQQNTSLVSVLGDVRTAGRFPASPSGERILDVIARAGGPTIQGYDVWVSLERKGHRASVPFGALIYEPANNIYVLPNDVIFLYNQPQTFLAFGAAGSISAATAISVNTSTIGGATGGPGLYRFDGWRLSLAEAIAKQGGLNDSLAEPKWVFLYRGETREVASRLGIDCSKYVGPIIPVIYNLNLRDPSGYFLAQKFEMRNKDVIYTSNAAAVETTKFLQFLRVIMATANDPISYATNGLILRNTINGTGSTAVITGVIQ
jgi:polysaccharide export outer membrane protein